MLGEARRAARRTLFVAGRQSGRIRWTKSMRTGRSAGRSGEAGSVKLMVRVERERRSRKRNRASVSGDILGGWRKI